MTILYQTQKITLNYSTESFVWGYTRDLNECSWNFKHLLIILICQWTRKTASIISEKVRRDPRYRDTTAVKVSQWNFWWGLPQIAVSYRQQLISSVFIKPFYGRWWVWPCSQSVEIFISSTNNQKFKKKLECPLNSSDLLSRYYRVYAMCRAELLNSNITLVHDSIQRISKFWTLPFESDTSQNRTWQNNMITGWKV